MQCCQKTAWIFWAFIAFGVFAALQPQYAYAQYAPEWAHNEAETVHTVVALDKVGSSPLVCSGSFNTENTAAAREEFLENLASDIWCSQTLDFDPGSPVEYDSSTLFTGGTMSWTYDIASGLDGPVSGDQTGSATTSAIREGAPSSIFGTPNICSYCDSNCSGCDYFFYTKPTEIDMEFSTQSGKGVGAVALSFSQLGNGGTATIILTHKDSSTTERELTAENCLYYYDQLFFGALVTDENKLITDIHMRVAGTAQICGVDNIFVATSAQVEYTPQVPPDDYGYPAVFIDEPAGNPAICCIGTAQSYDLAVNGTSSMILDAIEENEIDTYTWTLKAYQNGTWGNQQYSYNPTDTFYGLSPGLYDLNLYVTDQVGNDNSTSVSLALGDCGSSGAGETQFFIVPIRVSSSTTNSTDSTNSTRKWWLQ